jgi:hypothetical protein
VDDGHGWLAGLSYGVCAESLLPVSPAQPAVGELTQKGDVTLKTSPIPPPKHGTRFPMPFPSTQLPMGSANPPSAISRPTSHSLPPTAGLPPVADIMGVGGRKENC